ncbi:hypothetical protein NDU88_007295 [Pleurodeles waltl]|uniref:Uncharacterized protein n=1 Tax=Pleurodeles waltl TaxID=8319 RepID=A0AAV7WGM9_PLEWA|nr:hypothetical protein NDU88_007295 [Pleurodeles waltl]
MEAVIIPDRKRPEERDPEGAACPKGEESRQRADQHMRSREGAEDASSGQEGHEAGRTRPRWPGSDPPPPADSQLTVRGGSGAPGIGGENRGGSTLVGQTGGTPEGQRKRIERLPPMRCHESYGAHPWWERGMLAASDGGGH